MERKAYKKPANLDKGQLNKPAQLRNKRRLPLPTLYRREKSLKIMNKKKRLPAGGGCSPPKLSAQKKKKEIDFEFWAQSHKPQGPQVDAGIMLCPSAYLGYVRV